MPCINIQYKVDKIGLEFHFLCSPGKSKRFADCAQGSEETHQAWKMSRSLSSSTSSPPGSITCWIIMLLFIMMIFVSFGFGCKGILLSLLCPRSSVFFFSQKCNIVRRNTSKHLYHHFTVAIDTNNIRIVFKVFFIGRQFPTFIQEWRKWRGIAYPDF